MLRNGFLGSYLSYLFIGAYRDINQEPAPFTNFSGAGFSLFQISGTGAGSETLGYIV